MRGGASPLITLISVSTSWKIDNVRVVLPANASKVHCMEISSQVVMSAADVRFNEIKNDIDHSFVSVIPSL